jgi:hypothetical protein
LGFHDHGMPHLAVFEERVSVGLLQDQASVSLLDRRSRTRAWLVLGGGNGAPSLWLSDPGAKSGVGLSVDGRPGPAPHR